MPDPRENPHADTRLLSPDAAAESLTSDSPDAPMPTPATPLTDSPLPVGIWEAAPGVDVDVEVEELFVVLSGRGTVEFADGSTLDLVPGAVVHLHEGDHTTWRVTETLRKVYVQLPARSEEGPR
ncbi:cupin domain-containing protein [Pimelobacter simplex]|uniref:cupin domain-containing protein n=1 Tax=Nocardioides simplex TaxID=2045 RepID=UPI001931BA9D|nr:cupin domain-containing protein [Pimelobacter simplex]